MTTFAFDFAPSYRVPARLFGVNPSSAWVGVRDGQVLVRFGPWALRTFVDNISHVTETGDYAYVKTAGPPHLSFTDRGITFATNGSRGLCLQFHTPVPAMDPWGLLRHPGATVTVADLSGLREALGHA